MRFALLPLITAFILWLPVAAQAAPEIGQPTPDFTATDINGAKVSPADFKGKIVVLEWNNPDCPFVHKHYDSGNMQKLQAYVQSKGVVWLTINSSAKGKEGARDADGAKAYIAKVKAEPAHYILDPSGTIGKLYGAKATPHMFVIDAKGNVAYMGAIDNKPTPDPATLTGADNYVRDAIESLLAGQPVKVPFKQAYGCSIKYAD